MVGKFSTMLVAVAAASVLSSCASIKRVTDSNTTRDGTPCTRDSDEDDCTRYVQYEGLESGFKDQGFDEAHRKQGYENLREQRRQRREGSIRPPLQTAPRPSAPTIPDGQGQQ